MNTQYSENGINSSKFIKYFVKCHVKDPIRLKYIFLSMESWMNIEYKYNGIQIYFAFSIAQKQIKTLFSAPLQITGQQGSNLPQLQWQNNMCSSSSSNVRSSSSSSWSRSIIIIIIIITIINGITN